VDEGMKAARSYVYYDEKLKKQKVRFLFSNSVPLPEKIEIIRVKKHPKFFVVVK
jgi:hypothetical protein